MILGDLISGHCGKITVGTNTIIRKGASVKCADSITIGHNVMVEEGASIVDNNNHPVNPHDRIIIQQTPHASYERSWAMSAHAPIVIGNNVRLSKNSRVCKGVTIGDNATIAAEAVVTKDVPANAHVEGNPAKII